MINYLFILIFIGLIFLIILQKLIETNEIKKFKKINFLSVYLSLFILSYISISISYYFLGSTNISALNPNCFSLLGICPAILTFRSSVLKEVIRLIPDLDCNN